MTTETKQRPRQDNSAAGRAFRKKVKDALSRKDFAQIEHTFQQYGNYLELIDTEQEKPET